MNKTGYSTHGKVRVDGLVSENGHFVHRDDRIDAVVNKTGHSTHGKAKNGAERVGEVFEWGKEQARERSDGGPRD